MAKKRDNKKKDEEAALPKFAGFKPFAGGLDQIKAKLDAEKKAEDEKQKAAAAKGKPIPPARPEPARSAAPASRQVGRAESVRSSTSDLDDDMSFHRMMSGVTPLESDGKARVPMTTEVRPGAQRLKAAEVQARARTEAEQAIAHLHSIVDDTARFEVSDDGRRVEGRRVDAPPDLVRSLRRGMLPIDARLDLHGLGAEQAQAKLLEFLRAMRSRNERCVLVIHGKGDSVPGGGVLRGEMAAWLSQGKSREHVVAFVTARDDDGGEGAVYIALRR